MNRIDINCDMGESTDLFPYQIENDLAILQYVSSINVACGFHAGDAHTMHRLVEAALALDVAVGAHPSFYDRQNFGRYDMTIEPEILYDQVVYQLGALQSFLRLSGGRMHHVKPHGALYNMAAKDASLSDTLCSAVKDFDEGLCLYALSGSQMIASALRAGIKNVSEVFADRTYTEAGSLTPRTHKGALIEDERTATSQALLMAREGIIYSTNGKRIQVKAETICIHGDGNHALEFARSLQESFSKNHVKICRP